MYSTRNPLPPQFGHLFSSIPFASNTLPNDQTHQSRLQNPAEILAKATCSSAAGVRERKTDQSPFCQLLLFVVDLPLHILANDMILAAHTLDRADVSAICLLFPVQHIRHAIFAVVHCRIAATLT